MSLVEAEVAQSTWSNSKVLIAFGCDKSFKVDVDSKLRKRTLEDIDA